MEARHGAIDDAQDETCTWLLSHRCYSEWQNKGSPLLMLHDKPGSGKSTARERAYNLARARNRGNEAVTGFFFSSRGDPMEAKLEGFFGSILHQFSQNRGSFDIEAFRS